MLGQCLVVSNLSDLFGLLIGADFQIMLQPDSLGVLHDTLLHRDDLVPREPSDVDF